MNRRVDDIAKGNYSSKGCKILTSVDRVELVLKKGTQHRGSIKVGTGSTVLLRSYVYSDSYRIAFAKNSYTGSTFVLAYGIDTAGLDAGDEINADIVIVTNEGEKRIPVQAAVEEALPSPFDKVKTLEDFAKIAQGDFREAFHIFTNENFQGLLRAKNSRYLSLYKGLSQNPVTYRHLEEFLIAAGKKEKISLSVDRQKGDLSFILSSSIKETLFVYKSTWGYTRAELSTDGGFIELEKNVITDDDFIGRVCALGFVLNYEKLRGRRCVGKIIIKTVYESLEVEVEAVPDKDMDMFPATFRKSRLIRLYREFLALNLKKLDYRTWYDHARLFTDEIKEEGEDVLTRFLDAYLAYCQEQNAELIAFLWPIRVGEVKLNSPYEKAVYLYLAKKAGLLPQESSDITSQLFALRKQDPSNYLIAALYFEEVGKDRLDPSDVLNQLEQMYTLGCASPFLFLKAYEILSSQEALLRKLSPFMIRTLLFAQKEGILEESLLLRAAYLTVNIKKFYPALYRLLANGYKTCEKREIIEAVCRLVMNERSNGAAYHKWYALAVEKGLRITRLYEYYIETRPETLDVQLPESVKLYFSYTPVLSERKKAFLYASIVKFKDADPVAYENYEKPARDFAWSCLKAGKINEYYALLYSEFFPECKDAESAGYISNVIFYHRVTCKNKNMRCAVVCHKALNDVQSYPLRGGEAYIKIYGGDVSILFEDDKKRRFASTVDYALRPLMDIKKYASQCIMFGVWDTAMQLYATSEGLPRELNSRSLMNLWKASENVYFTVRYRNRIRQRLLNYFLTHSDDWNNLHYIESLKELTYAAIDKAKTFEMLMDFSLYDKAFSIVSRMGYERIPSGLLLRLALAMIRQARGEVKEDVLEIALYVYRNGSFNTDILEYISAAAPLDVKDTHELWVKMSDFGCDTYYIEEEYLQLSLLTHVVTDDCETILENYAAKGGKPSIRREYLKRLSLLYILNDRGISKKTAGALKALAETDTGEDIECALAWAKYTAQSGAYSDKDKELLKDIAVRCAKNNLCFSFFKELPSEVTSALDIEDKVIAEEIIQDAQAAVIHYKIESEERQMDYFKSEPLNNGFNGCFSKKFLLFYGESLSFYFTAQTPEGPIRTYVKKLRAEEGISKGNTRYSLLNDMLMQRSLGTRDKMDESMKDYLWREAFVGEMFSLRK